jgi:hypothetical protein
MIPEGSGDESVPFYHWWPENNQWVWMQYDFEKPERISKSKVYWFDDEPRGGCRIPDEWEILYKSGSQWKPVRTLNPYAVTKDGWDSVAFEPVTTDAVRINVKLKKEFSSGIHEWIIE